MEDSFAKFVTAIFIIFGFAALAFSVATRFAYFTGKDVQLHLFEPDMRQSDVLPPQPRTFRSNIVEIPEWKEGDQQNIGEWTLNQYKANAYIDYYISGLGPEPCRIKPAKGGSDTVRLTPDSKVVDPAGKVRITITNSNKEIKDLTAKLSSPKFRITEPKKMGINILPGASKDISWDVVASGGGDAILKFEITSDGEDEEFDARVNIESKTYSRPVAITDDLKGIPQISLIPADFTMPLGDNEIKATLKNNDCFSVSYDFNLVPVVLPNYYPNNPKIKPPSVQRVDLRGGESKEIKWQLNASDYGFYIYKVETLADKVQITEPSLDGRTVGFSNEIRVIVAPESGHKIGLSIEGVEGSGHELNLKKVANKPGDLVKFNIKLTNQSDDRDTIALNLNNSIDKMSFNGSKMAGWNYYLLEDGQLKDAGSRTITLDPQSSHDFTLVLSPTGESDSDIPPHYYVGIHARSKIFYSIAEAMVAADAGWKN